MTRFDYVIDWLFGTIELGTLALCLYSLHYWWSITPP